MNFHARIMNIKGVGADTATQTAERHVRHSAAEIATEADSIIDEALAALTDIEETLYQISRHEGDDAEAIKGDVHMQYNSLANIVERLREFT